MKRAAWREFRVNPGSTVSGCWTVGSPRRFPGEAPDPRTLPDVARGAAPSLGGAATCGPAPGRAGERLSYTAAMTEITRLIEDASGGDGRAAERLLEAVYGELRRLASARLARERPGQTLQATALVHEAWLRLAGDGREDWKSRGYFFAAAAEAMRRILVERARARARLKRGGDVERVDLEEVQPIVLPESIDLLALDEALTKLAREDPRKAKLVELRYFTGLTLDQAARALDISPATADRYWAYARAFLYHEVRKGD